MSAFRRRTAFAAPLIISLATSCSKKEDIKTTSRFDVQWDVRRVEAGACEAQQEISCPPNAECNPPPPRAIECPSGTSGRTVIRVAQVATDKCGIVPKGCEDSSCVKLATPCPLPSGQKLPAKLVEVWVVEKNKNGDGGCHAEEPSPDCPPGVDCNPPVPRKIACPPGVTDTVEVKVGLLPDKTCAVVPEGCTAPACAKPTTACP